MRTIHQGHLPVRTLVLIGMVILITAQAYIEGVRQVNRKLYRIFFYLQ